MAHRVFTVLFLVMYGCFFTFTGLFLFSPNRDEEYDGVYDRLYFNEYRTGALYRDLRYERTVTRFTPVLFVVKRLVFVLCAFHSSNPTLSISTFEVITLINIAYLMTIRPYKDETLLKFEIFNDLITLGFVMFLQGMFELMPEADKFNLAWVLVGILGLYFLVHLSYQAISQVKVIK